MCESALKNKWHTIPCLKLLVFKFFFLQTTKNICNGTDVFYIHHLFCVLYFLTVPAISFLTKSASAQHLEKMSSFPLRYTCSSAVDTQQALSKTQYVLPLTNIMIRFEMFYLLFLWKFRRLHSWVSKLVSTAKDNITK